MLSRCPRYEQGLLPTRESMAPAATMDVSDGTESRVLRPPASALWEILKERIMTLPTRRTFHQQLLGSLLTYGLIETLFHQDLLADTVKPVVHKWLKELN